MCRMIIEGSSGDMTSHTSGPMTLIAWLSGPQLWTVDQKLLMYWNIAASACRRVSLLCRQISSAFKLFKNVSTEALS